MSEEEYVSVGKAAYISGIGERTLRYWIQNGKLAARSGKRGKLVKQGDVLELAQLTGRDGGSLPDMPADPSDSPSEVAFRRQGESGRAIVAHLEQMYRDTIQAKDDAIAARIAEVEAKDQLIEELRRRLAEQDSRQTQREEQLAGSVPEVESTTRSFWQRFKDRAYGR